MSTETKPMLVIDGKEFTFAPPPDHSCYSCKHYAEEPLTYFEDDGLRYCEVTNCHNLHTWPFAYTICKKWEKP